MAIKKSISTVFGFEVVDAYHRVEGVRLDGKDKIMFQRRSYTDTAFAAVEDVGYECAYDIQGPNPIAQAYAHLKTLSEFEGAVDC
jgi:hypothetical protein